MKKRKARVGDFVKYILNPTYVAGMYGLVFRIFDNREFVEFQVVWFGEKQHQKKHWNVLQKFSSYDISGGSVYESPDCKIIISKPPKRILKRVEAALFHVIESEKLYDSSLSRFTNLDMIEILARMKKLV